MILLDMYPILYRDYAALQNQTHDFYDCAWFMKQISTHRWQEYILRSQTEIPLDVFIQAKIDGLRISIPPKQPSLEVIDFVIENYDLDTFYQVDNRMTEMLTKRLFACRQITDSQKVFMKLKYKIDIKQ